MLFSELIRHRLVLLGLEAESKEEALSRIVAHLAASGGIPPHAETPVMESVLARERFMSTGMEKGIALPHGMTKALDEEVACLAIAPLGVPFQSIDGLPTRIIILLVTPVEKSLTRVRTLSKIASVVNQEDIRTRLVGARSVEDAIAIILEAEGPRSPD